MAYFSLGSFVGIFYEGAILIILILLMIESYRIYRVSRMKLTLDLLLGWIFVNFAVFFSWLAKIYLTTNAEDALGGDFLIQLIYKLKFSLGFVVIANLYFSTFFKTIFSEDGARPPIKITTIIRKVIELTIIIVVQIPTFITRDPQIALVMDSIAFFVTVFDSLFFIPAFTKAYQKSKIEAFGKKYFNISVMAFFMFAWEVMFLIDRITMAANISGLFGELGYTIFYFLAWACVIMAEILSIYGYVRK